MLLKAIKNQDMKYLITLLSTLLFLPIFSFANGGIFTGLLKNDTASQVFLYIAPTDYSARSTTLKADVENGRFRIDFDINERTEAAFVIDRITLPMLLEPGDSLHVDMIQESGERLIAWSGKDAPKNHFFLQYALFSNPILDYIKKAELFKSGDAVEYLRLVKDYERKRLNFIKNFNPETMPMPERWAIEWLTNKVRYETAQALLDFPREYRVFNKGKKVKLPDGYYSFLRDISFGREDLLSQISYRDFILTWFNEYIQPQANYDWVYSGFPKEQYRFAGKKLMRSDKTFIQYIVLKDANRWNYKVLDKEMKDFMKSDAPPSAKEDIRLLWVELQQTYEGSEIPNYEFVTHKGDTVSLSDMRGKVLYVDFWATWCKPCIREMPASAELRDIFKEESELVFMYVSVDKSAEVWRKWLKKKGVDEQSLHVQATKESMEDIRARWGHRGIPFFLIINEDGKIVDEEAKRPSSQWIVKDLKKVLKNGDL